MSCSHNNFRTRPWIEFNFFRGFEGSKLHTPNAKICRIGQAVPKTKGISANLNKSIKNISAHISATIEELVVAGKDENLAEKNNSEDVIESSPTHAEDLKDENNFAYFPPKTSRTFGNLASLLSAKLEKPYCRKNNLVEFRTQCGKVWHAKAGFFLYTHLILFSHPLISALIIKHYGTKIWMQKKMENVRVPNRMKDEMKWHMHHIHYLIFWKYVATNDVVPWFKRGKNGTQHYSFIYSKIQTHTRTQK